MLLISFQPLLYSRPLAIVGSKGWLCSLVSTWMLHSPWPISTSQATFGFLFFV